MLRRQAGEFCHHHPLRYHQSVVALMGSFVVNVLPSAGVPKSTTFPPRPSLCITSAVANAAATDDTAIRLCPQACPSPLSASVLQRQLHLYFRCMIICQQARFHQDLPYSALNDTVGPGLPLSNTATNAVPIPYADGVTSQVWHGCVRI